MSSLRIYVLGAPRLQRGDAPVELHLRRAMALAVYFADTGRSHARDSLASLLWADGDDGTARARLRRTLYRLTEAIGADAIDADADSVRLAENLDLWVDSHAFEASAAVALAGSPGPQPGDEQRLAAAKAADALYQDDFLAGFSLPDAPDWDAWQTLRREQLRQTCARVREFLVGALRVRGEWTEAIVYAQRWLALDNLNESAHRALIQLYAFSGQRGAALRHYQECVRILDAELGVRPEDTTIALYEAIRTRRLQIPEQQARQPIRAPDLTPNTPIQPASQVGVPPQPTPAGGASVVPPPPSALETGLMSGLPAPAARDITPPTGPLAPRIFRGQRGRLIGREADARLVCSLLLREDIGLVTLTGPGGSGKTRLALQVAADLADQFEHGVGLVNLGLISDPAAVPAAMVQALDVLDLGDHAPLDRLRGHLYDRHFLLVLDNFEHVLPAHTVVTDLLEACPRLKVLVTSRAVLRVYGEHEVTVPPLDSPAEDDRHLTVEAAAQFPAVELFVERARAVRPDFVLTSDNCAAVVAICRQLDGLPLAIELAAARSRLLSPRAMLGRLEHRLALLTDGPRDLPARQQTLRGAIAWSYDLLTPGEQRLFRRLGTFVGGWTLDAAEAIGAQAETGRPPTAQDTDLQDTEILDTVSSLLDKSLLVTLDEHDGEPRFGMLETIREFAVEQLSASGEADLLRQRHADYFLALAEQADPCLITGEQVHWLARLEAEHANISAALGWLTSQDSQEAACLGLRLAGALHWYWWLGGPVAEGRAWIRETLSRVRPDDPEAMPARARALYAAGGLAMVQGEYHAAAALFDEAGTLYRQLGDRRGAGRALTYHAIQEIVAGDQQQARARLLEGIELLRALDDRWGLALAGSNLASVARRLGDLHEADRLLAEYVALARQTGDRYLLGSALPKWGNVALDLGDLDRAERYLQEALGLFRALNDGWWTARCLHILTVIAVQRGDMLHAARLLGATEHLLQSAGARLVPTDEVRSRQLAETMRAALGAARFDAVCAGGRAADVECIVQEAMSTAAERIRA